MTRQVCWFALLFLLSLATSSRAAPQLRPGKPKMSDTYIIETNLGSITIELDSAKAPLHAANFKAYADAGFFDGLIFHRVIPDFMIQGGGHQQGMAAKDATGAKVKNESLNGLKNLRGTLAAARTSDPDSASAQFFINLKDNAFLDGDASTKKPGYSVFGKVTAGMDVVDQIAKTKTGMKNGLNDVPVTEMVIVKVKKG